MSESNRSRSREVMPGEAADALRDDDADDESSERAECDTGSDAADGGFIIVQANPLHNQTCGGGSNVRITWQEPRRVRVQEEGHAPTQFTASRHLRGTLNRRMIDRPSDELTLTLPDGSTRTVAYGTLPRDVVASIGAGLVARRRRRRGQRRGAGSHDAAARERRLPRAHGEGSSARSTCCATRPRTCSRPRCAGCAPRPQIGFGPAIEDGFYYDFEVDRAVHSRGSREDSRRRCGRSRREVSVRARRGGSRRGAQQKFVDDPLKLERLSELGDDEVISTYTDGPFIDLCRGPHVPDTSRIKHFKLLHTAGAYWRGDEQRQMLQRIYGTAWLRTRKISTAYLHRLEEAKRRDHRTLGARARSLLHRPARGRRGSSSGIRAARSIRNEIEDLRARAHSAPRLRARLHAAHREREAVRDLRASRELSRRTCSARWRSRGSRIGPSR